MRNQKNSWILSPTIGILFFVIIYGIATLFYPGGSQVDKKAVGFSWLNNYWCNLLNEKAINGQLNPAKPIAMTGMLVLCLSLSYFWYLFPILLNFKSRERLSVQISGMLAMTVAFFLFTDIDHDLITNIASLFGLIAIVGTIVGLYQSKWYKLFTFGILNFLLIGVNSFVYYHKELIVYLPIIQKISFATFLAWVCFINVKTYQTQSPKNR